MLATKEASASLLLGYFSPQDGDQAAQKRRQSLLALGEYFDSEATYSPFVIEGLLREGQIMVLGGPFNVGKSPFLADMCYRVSHGIPWFGHHVRSRPTIMIDFENSKHQFIANMRRLDARFAESALANEEIEPHVWQGDLEDPHTGDLLGAIVQGDGIGHLRRALERHPSALVTIDPLEMLVSIDTLKKKEVLGLIVQMRQLISNFPEAALVFVFNLRKQHPDPTARANLLVDPNRWLEEICGSLDIVNRSDVRIGMDHYDGERKLINGVRRGETMDPIIIESVGDYEEGLQGFELCSMDRDESLVAFKGKQLEHWRKLPTHFRFLEMADQLVPRKSLGRLLERARSLGLVVKDGDSWTKT